MILIFPPYWIRKTPVFNQEESTQQNAPIVEDKTPEVKLSASLYRGIVIDREGLKGYLSRIFAQYGISEKVPQAEYTISKESEWVWYADNGVSKNICQYTAETWHDFCEGFGRYEDMNPHEAMACMAKMWSMGLEVRWETWCKKYGVGLKKCEWANGPLTSSK